LRVVKAFRMKDAASADLIRAYLERSEMLGHPPYAVLVDAYVPGLAGGTGTSIADDLLGLIPRYSRLILAGGLTPENVAERAGTVGPWMVDVASGVESAPGRKCPERIATFVAALRTAEVSPEEPPTLPSPARGEGFVSSPAPKRKTLPPCGGGWGGG
jgi:phosphoribosylanthranilate isomerase